jgi:hypothetical protein
MQVGQAHHCCTHAHRHQPGATSLVESSGDLVAWRWPYGVQLEWVSRQDMGKAAQTIAQRPMVLEEAGVKSLPVIASEAKQSMYQRARWAWIASSAALLAMTVAGITTPAP